MEILFDSRALVIRTKTETSIVVSDLHLGFHVELSAKTGVSFPPQQEVMFEELKRLVERYDAATLYLNGDVKHTITVDSPFNWEVVPEFLERLSDKTEVMIIPGNHDGDLSALLPRDVEMTDVHGMIVSDLSDSVGILHGHAWPSSQVLDTQMLVIGHTHPAIRRMRVVSAKGNHRPDRVRSAGVVPVVVRSPLNKSCVRKNIGEPTENKSPSGVIVTLPAFNPLIKGISINMPDSDLFGPLFDNDCADVSNSEVYSPEGILLGTVQFLKQQIEIRNR